nr:PREDICTED: uncharacterized protein LOC103980986 isoform X1 [Musa acuminata subsp. malaccensis]
MEAAVATATLGIWDEEGCSKSILQEWQLRSRTVFRTAFVPSQNPNPETLVLAASSDGSIATLSVFGKNKHEIISTCEDRKYPATFLALMALPFSKAVSGLYVALYWRSHVVSFGTQGLCIWLTRIPYWYKPECKNEFQWSFSTNGIGSSFGIFCFPLPSWNMVAMERAMSIRYSFRLQTSVWPWSSSGGCPYAYHNIAWISKHDK